MWVQNKKTPEETKANPLSAFNIKTNEDGEIVGIQLVFLQTGKSPFLEAETRRALDESSTDPPEAPADTTSLGPES